MAKGKQTCRKPPKPVVENRRTEPHTFKIVYRRNPDDPNEDLDIDSFEPALGKQTAFPYPIEPTLGPDDDFHAYLSHVTSSIRYASDLGFLHQTAIMESRKLLLSLFLQLSHLHTLHGAGFLLRKGLASSNSSEENVTKFFEYTKDINLFLLPTQDQEFETFKFAFFTVFPALLDPNTFSENNPLAAEVEEA